MKSIEAGPHPVHIPLFTNIVTFLLLFGEWVLMGFSSFNNDYASYQIMYDATNFMGINTYTNLDYGQRLLYRVGGIFNLSYSQFLPWYVGISMLILWFGIRKLTNNSSLVFMLYFIFPFFYDVTQIRNFCALTIIIYAFHFLCDNNSRLSLAKYVVLVILATLIHSSSVFYLLFILIKIRRISTLWVISLISAGVLGLLYSFGSHLGGISILTSRLTLYAAEGKASAFYILLYSIVFVFNFSLLYMIRHSMDDTDDFFWVVDTIYRAAIVLFVCLPLVFINQVYFRLFRNFLLLTYSAVGIYSSNFIHTKAHKVILLVCTILIFAIVNCYTWLVSDGKYLQLIAPIFKYNIFGVN